MPEDVTSPDAPPESPSGAEPVEGADPESPSGDLHDDEIPPDPAEGDDEPPAEDEIDDEGKPTEASARREWEALEKKFAHIEDPEARKDAIARAYWDKARYAKRTREELQSRVSDLEKRLAERDAKPPEPDKPPEPHPDVVKVEQRIRTLYERDQKIQTESSDLLQQLSKADRAVAIAEDRLARETYDEQKGPLEQAVQQARRDFDYLRRQLVDNDQRREDIQESMRQALADRDWVLKFQESQARTKANEQRETERFEAEFPKLVEREITEQADKLGIPKDPEVRKMLHQVAEADLLVFFRKNDSDDVDEVDWQGRVTDAIRRFASGLDVVKRRTFQRRSTEKLDVTGRPGPGKAAPTTPVPASQRPPVPAALLARDVSPEMARAREILVKKYS